MVWMTTLSGDTSLWTVGGMFFLLGAGLGLIMQNVVLAAQNAVSPAQIGTATSTNNYFREVGATLGVAVFGTLFTSRLAENLGRALTANAEEAVQAGITSPDTLVPSAVQAAGEPLKSAIVDAYANSLAPVFWYLVPILAVAFLLALALKEIPLSDMAGMVARGEAVNSEEELAALPCRPRSRRWSSSRTGRFRAPVPTRADQRPSRAAWAVAISRSSSPAGIAAPKSAANRRIGIDPIICSRLSWLAPASSGSAARKPVSRSAPTVGCANHSATDDCSVSSGTTSSPASVTTASATTSDALRPICTA